MAVPECDISILIPTYRYRDKVGRAVESALASGAGEIIVIDDHSGDGTMELLAGYDDPRLRVFENSRNMGLWENHLEALRHATKPWIKFIQADDYLLPGGLAAYAAAADREVSVVWSSAVVKDDETGAVMQFQNLDAPRRVDGYALLEACIYLGWILGSPSHMMLRADVIEVDHAAWITEISADLVQGTVAATRGKIALLPSGAMGQGAHSSQDSKTESSGRGLRRMVSTIAYLSARPEPELRRFAGLWAAMNGPMAHRIAIKGTLLGNIPPLEAARLLMRYRAMARGAGAENKLLRAARAYRRSALTPHDLGAVLDQLELAHVGTCP